MRRGFFQKARSRCVIPGPAREHLVAEVGEGSEEEPQPASVSARQADDLRERLANALVAGSLIFGLLFSLGALVAGACRLFDSLPSR